MNKNEEKSEVLETERMVESPEETSAPSSDETALVTDVVESTVDIAADESDLEDESAAVVNEESDVQVDTFESLGLEAEVLKGIQEMSWSQPTPVQSKCLPHTIPGRDVAGFAQTGTGKTGVFLISIANEIVKLKRGDLKGKSPLAIILVPTRELAVQIQSDASELFGSIGISSLAVYGGVDYDKQAKAIKSGVEVIVATPGRLKDYHQKKVLSLKSCLQFVCDEADRMFDMGFIEDVEYFLRHLGEETQKLLFSATTNEQVKELAFEYLESPQYISVSPEVMTPERIDQHGIICESTEKLSVLLGLIKSHNPKCSIIFTNTKLVAEWVHYKLVNNGIEADLITGDLPQKKRISLIERIKKGQVKALIATDVASRGLHISDISHVYNFDLPGEAANYVHRIGRTARAGARGSAYSLICEDYGQNLEQIREYVGEKAEIQICLASEDLLAVEDKAKNPYRDPNFKGTTAVTKQKQDKVDKKPRGKTDQRYKSGDKRGGRNNKRNQFEDKGSRSRKGNQKHSSGRSSYNKHKDSHKRRNQKPVSKHMSEAPAANRSLSIGGLIKKFLKLFFGGRK